MKEGCIKFYEKKIMQMNIKEFYKVCEVNVKEKKCINKQKPKKILVKTFPWAKFEGKDDPSYSQYCKIQLMNYKPFENLIH